MVIVGLGMGNEDFFLYNIMFKDLDKTDFFDILSDKSKPIINHDRMVLNPIYELIKNYCRHHQLFISNVKLILNMDDEMGPLLIYCENPYRHATILTNMIDDKIGRWVRMLTKKTHEHFFIEYDTREIAQLYNIEVERGISTMEMVGPITIDSNYYLPYDIEIIELCHKLYNPKFVDEWENLYREFIIMREKKEVIEGGATECEPCKKRVRLDISLLRLDLLFSLLADTSKKYIMVGQWAYNLITTTNEITIHKDKLQVISQFTIDEDLLFINEAINKNGDIQIFYREHNMHIPKDFRIRRYTIYVKINIGGIIKDKPIMDIYNSTQFEIVPYVKKIITNNGKDYKFYIGNYFVMYRFFAIYIWVINVINKMVKRDNELIQEIKKDINEMMANLSEIWDYKFGTNYAGKFIDYTIADKLENLKSRHLPYIPHLAKKIGKYKNMY